MGEKLEAKDITMKRPGGGDFGPKDFEKIIGSYVLCDIPANSQIKAIQIDNY